MHEKHSSSIQLKCDVFLCSVAVLVTCIQQQEHVQVGVVSIQPLPKLRCKLMKRSLQSRMMHLGQATQQQC